MNSCCLNEKSLDDRAKCVLGLYIILFCSMEGVAI